MVIRDDTGQVIVRTVQRQRFLLGGEVDAVGRVAVSGAQWVLEPALCKRCKPLVASDRSLPRNPTRIGNVGQVRGLSAEEAARAFRWPSPARSPGRILGNYFTFRTSTTVFGEYSTRGDGSARPVKYLTIEGVTASETFSPVVEVKRYIDLGP